MRNIPILFGFAVILTIGCAKDAEIGSAEIAYDAAVLAVSVRMANESYDASATQSCGNSSHFGVQNREVTVLRSSSARSEGASEVVATGRTSNRGSVVFKNLELGDYTVQVGLGDVSIEKEVKIAEKKRISVIVDL